MYFCTGFILFNATSSRVIKVWYRLRVYFFSEADGIPLFVHCSAGYLQLGWLHLGYC